MRVGTVCYATEQGLGYLAKAFYDNGVVTDPVIIRHGSRSRVSGWYPGALIADRPYQLTDLAYPFFDRLAACDVVLFFETPFDWTLIPRLRSKGVKTVLMPMYECEPAVLPEVPDLFINPSALDQRYYPTGVHVPVPAPSFQEVPWRARGVVEAFVHNAGHGGLKGRNGTAEVVNAWRYVKSPAKLLVRAQGEFNLGDYGYPIDDVRVTLQTGTFDRKTLYDAGEVFLFPEKFNGLSLPLQEAYAAGMLVMATDRFPNNTYLPHPPLIPTDGSRKNRVSQRCNEFDEAVVRPEAVAEMVDAWYGKDVGEFGGMGRVWREENSWERLRPRYLEVLAK
jgi:hypothetical protein